MLGHADFAGPGIPVFRDVSSFAITEDTLIGEDRPHDGSPRPRSRPVVPPVDVFSNSSSWATVAAGEEQFVASFEIAPTQR